MNLLSIREIEKQDIQPIADYWLLSGNDFLTRLGVDVQKMPVQKEWEEMLEEQIRTPLREKNSYCMIWLMDGIAVGHSNINKIIWGEEAYMHLHIWNANGRKKGMGIQFLKLTIPHFFKTFHLKKLYCEPYALNDAPNKTLDRAGFRFVKLHTTTPGWINFEQPVKLWEIDQYNID